VTEFWHYVDLFAKVGVFLIETPCIWELNSNDSCFMEDTSFVCEQFFNVSSSQCGQVCKRISYSLLLPSVYSFSWDCRSGCLYDDSRWLLHLLNGCLLLLLLLFLYFCQQTYVNDGANAELFALLNSDSSCATVQDVQQKERLVEADHRCKVGNSGFVQILEKYGKSWGPIFKKS